MDREEFIKKKMREQKLTEELNKLYADCTDLGVENFFDLFSEKMLAKKVRVLRALNDGVSPDKLGKDYYDILEKLHVPDGQVLVVGSQVLDPHKYD